MLEGKKTYLAAAGIAIVAVTHFMGLIDDSTAQTLYALLGASGFAALRAGVAKGR